MSDFGFDAHALDEVDTAGRLHPLEIARDLIGSGRARAALDLLSEHHETLMEDPEYLLLCAEAWIVEGDGLRAQQALLGAARVAPEDPRPLLWLGELLEERGELDKAQLVLNKARALEARPSWTEAHDVAPELETEDDLIAFAERQERSAQAALSPKQILLGLFAVAVVALIVGGIAFITSPRGTASPSPGVGPGIEEAGPEVAGVVAAETALAEEPGEAELSETVSRTATAAEEEQAVAVPVEQPSGAVQIATPEPVPPVAAAPAAAVVPPKSVKQASRPQARKVAPPRREPEIVVPQTKEPDAKVVEADLASMNPQQLTTRADALYAQGHTGAAASYYRRALELDPDYAPALVGMGQGILRAKKYSDAMKNATRALHLARGVDARPGLEAVAIYQMGRVHYERGERDAARRLFRQSISLPGTPAEAWFYLGEALSSDNSPAAREAYEQYLELVSSGHLAVRARRAIQ